MQSEVIKDIMGTVPKWSIRWGMTVILIVLVLMLLMSNYVRYPDTIGAEIQITRSTPPFYAISKSAGRLDKLWVKDKDYISEGDYLVSIDDQSEIEDVMKLRSHLKLLQNGLFSDGFEQSPDLPSNLNLGSLQFDYTSFINRYSEIKQFKSQTPILHEIEGMNNQLKQNKELLRLEIEKKNTFSKEIELAYTRQKRNETLYVTNVISKEQYESFQKEVFSQERLMAEIDVDIAKIRLEIVKLEMGIERLKIENESRWSAHQHETIEAYRRLAVAISTWEEKYLIRSPISGRVSLGNFWSSNQNVRLGEVILVVVPDKKFEIVGKMSIAPKNSGKVRIGQKVFVRMNNYPYEEFGSLVGSVKTISPAPIDNIYLVEVQFNQNALTTTYGKEINYQDGLSGAAEIILQESSLLTRIFNIVLGRANKYSESK